DERTESKTVPVFGQDERQIRNGKGYPLQINATIGVPKSYFVRLLQDSKGGASASPVANSGGAGAGNSGGNVAPVDQAALDSFVQTESDRIKGSITPLIDTKAIEGATAGTVTVSMFPDFAPGVMGGSSGNSRGDGGGGSTF